MVTLKASPRQIFGKQLKASREEGLLPVVVYGRKEKSQSFFVNIKEFKKVLASAGESTIVSFESPTGNLDVLIYAVDYHPVKNEPIHADLYVVEKGKKVEVNVPLLFVGEAPAVKELGGTLVKVLHELKVEALPKDLPHEIEVDVSGLASFEDRIMISDLKLPTGVQVNEELTETVALVSEQTEEEPEEIETEASIEDIEVEKKGKQEEVETESPEEQ
jgi:large subunit ribosomal protein L25